MDVSIQQTNEGKTVVEVIGRLDTTNAIEFEKLIQPLLTQSNPDYIVNCSGINYISSSGLRQFLTLQKWVLSNQGQMVLRNMLPEIKEIFDMTGFSSIFIFE